MASDQKKSVGWRSAALIGAGRMGRAHAQALRKLGVPLTAVCDVRPAVRHELGAEFSVPEERRFASADAMFAAIPGFDIVCIATTADTHCELTCMAAAKGARNILCEKPLAVSVAECDAMIAACNASDTTLAVNHQMRFMDQYKIVKEEFDSGKLGRLASMTVVAGCFGLSMNGSHYVEAFSYLTGGSPVEATGWFTGKQIQNPRGPQFFDQAGEFRIVADTGQRLTLIIGHDQGHGMTVTYAGAYGHVFVDELEGEAIITSRQPEHRSMPATRYGMPWTRVSRRFAQSDNVEPTRAVLAALAVGEDYPTGESGRRAVTAIAACFISAEEGNRSVSIDEVVLAGSRRFSWA